MTPPIRILINGFGRIGRTVLRQILTQPGHDDIDVVAINDIAPLDTCAYLFRYDSVYGPFPGGVTTDANALCAADTVIPVWSHADLRAADLSNVDLVLECTGRAKTREIATAGLDAGASKILISGPSPAADSTIVLGANDAQLADQRIISNASCTTNAIAPLLRALDDALGIARAHVTTIHCYTGGQPIVDVPGPSLERSRAAAVSMVPTTTSAASQITEILPSFADRLSVAAVRVPSLSVSAVDATLQLSSTTDQTLPDILKDCAMFGVTDDACVSTDMRARPESLVLSTRETMWVGPTQLRLFGWYDNEWGFSARMIDMTRRMTRP